MLKTMSYQEACEMSYFGAYVFPPHNNSCDALWLPILKTNIFNQRSAVLLDYDIEDRMNLTNHVK